jgi:hypothetical protein
LPFLILENLKTEVQNLFYVGVIFGCCPEGKPGFMVFKTKCEGKYLHPREGNRRECGDNCILESAILFIMHYSVEQIQKNAIGRTCRTLGRYRRSIRIILK